MSFAAKTVSQQATPFESRRRCHAPVDQSGDRRTDIAVVQKPIPKRQIEQLYSQGFEPITESWHGGSTRVKRK